MSKLSCPYCGNPNTRTIDTRSFCSGKLILRIRECKCDFRWNTVETLYDDETRNFLAERYKSTA